MYLSSFLSFSFFLSSLFSPLPPSLSLSPSLPLSLPPSLPPSLPLSPSLSLSQYMLIHTTDSNDMVAIEACEFWLTIAEITDICKISLQPYLARLERESIDIHTLYTGIVF